MSFYFGLTAALTLGGAVLRVLFRNKRRGSLLFCVLAFLVLGSVSAFRYDVGYDYSAIYYPLYLPFLEDPLVSSAGMVHEPGFILLERLTALLSKNYQTLFVVTGFLVVGLFLLYYYKYSPNPVLSVFLFLSLGHFYGSMNFIRQSLAGVICLFALPLLQKKKFWSYLALALLASAFHSSALVMIPFFFVGLLPVGGHALAIIIPAAVILYQCSTGLIALVTGFAYSHYSLEDPLVAAGFPLGFLLIILGVFLFLYLGRRALTAEEPRNSVYLTYALFALLFIFLGTKHSILDRFSLYFGLASPVGIPLLLEGLRGELPGFRELFRKLRERTLSRREFRRLGASLLGLLLVLLGGTAAHAYTLSYDGHGVVPYQLIFTHPAYPEYLESLEEENAPQPEAFLEEAPDDEPEEEGP